MGAEKQGVIRNISFSRTEGTKPTSIKMSDNDTLKNPSSGNSSGNTTGQSDNIYLPPPGRSHLDHSSSDSGENSNSRSGSGSNTESQTNSKNLSIPKSTSFQNSNHSTINSASLSNSNSVSTNKNSSKGSTTAPRKPSVSSLGNTSMGLYRNTTANRASMLSEYSGIIQHVDIDTIKYVGNKESLQLSQLSGLSSSSDELLVLHSPSHSRNNSIVSMDSTKEQKGGLKRLQSVDSVNMAKILKSNSENSPVKKHLISSPPKSPLPKLNETGTSSMINPSINSSPLKNKSRRRSTSSNSSTSSRVNSKLDNIMKEVEHLTLEFGGEQDDEIEKKLISKAKQAPESKSMSLTSTSNSLVTASSSFHTANASISSHQDANFEDFEAGKDENAYETGDDDSTRNLDLDIAIPPRKSRLMTLDPSAASTIKLKEPPLHLQGSSRDEVKIDNDIINMERNMSTESLKTHTKTASSNSNPSQHTPQGRSSGSYKTKSSSSHKSKRRSTSSKGKIKPFSYETLAKLLNATDGIILGQEFATLNIPAEEKFLIERIVDSISRLTANMMLNPARYDQSCARLERVLNVLEGFD